METIPLTYDLAPLAWWQNPWIIATLSAAVLACIGVGGCAYYYMTKQRRSKPPSKKDALSSLLTQWQYIYDNQSTWDPTLYPTLTQSLKIYITLEYGLETEAKTDEECIAQIAHVSPPHESLVQLYTFAYARACSIKFGGSASWNHDNAASIIMQFIVMLKESIQKCNVAMEQGNNATRIKSS